jgi:transcriptional regulator with XRE-family HTH domain
MKTMKNTNSARKVSSPLLKGLLDSISPLQKEKTRAKMAIAAAIADAMKHEGINKSTLAAKVGKQPSEVTKWLSGTHNFTIDTLVEIAEAMHLKFEQLIGEAPNAQPRQKRIVIHLVATQAGYSIEKQTKPRALPSVPISLQPFRNATYA